MSVADEILRLQTAKSDLKTAIEGKGVTVSSSATIDGYADLVEQISGGGGDEGVEKKDINFYDIDGKRIYSYTLAEAHALMAMPTPPDHSNDFVPLTSQGWNWTFEQLQSLTYPQAEIGALYAPTDGCAHIVIEIPDGRNNLEYTISVGQNNGCSVIIEWGDGESSATTQHVHPVTMAHIYTSPGKYDVKVYASQSQYGGVYLNSVNVGRSLVNFDIIRSVHLPAEATNTKSTISYIPNTIILTIPDGQTRFPTLEYSNLCAVIIPPSIVNTANRMRFSYVDTVCLPYSITITSQTLETLYTLRNFSIPPGVSLPGIVIRSCQRVRTLWIPEGITALKNQAFQSMNGLAEVHLPSSLTSIGSQVLEGANMIFSEGKLFIAATTPPSLGSYFQVSGWTVYVPYSEDHSILEAYKTATNWSAFAAYMEEYNF